MALARFHVPFARFQITCLRFHLAFARFHSIVASVHPIFIWFDLALLKLRLTFLFASSRAREWLSKNIHLLAFGRFHITSMRLHLPIGWASHNVEFHSSIQTASEA